MNPADIAAAIRSGQLEPATLRALIAQSVAERDSAEGQAEGRGKVPVGRRYRPLRLDSPRIRLSPDRYLTVPGLDLVAPGLTLATKIQFTDGPCRILGWSAIAVDLTAGSESADTFIQALMAVQVRINSNERITTDGKDPSFVSFATLFGNSDGYAPLSFDLKGNDTISFVFTNNWVGGHSLLPAGLTLYAQDINPL